MNQALIPVLIVGILVGCADKHPPAIERPGLAVVGVAPKGNAAAVANGFFVSSDGVLVTCAHALGSSRTAVLFAAGVGIPILEATALQIDAEHDLALLKVTVAGEFAWLPLHDGDVAANQHVRIVTSRGAVHARFDHWEAFGRDLALTAELTADDRGSPVVGDDGRVIGVARGPSSDHPGQSLATPVWAVTRMLPKSADVKREAVP